MLLEFFLAVLINESWPFSLKTMLQFFPAVLVLYRFSLYTQNILNLRFSRRHKMDRFWLLANQHLTNVIGSTFDLTFSLFPQNIKHFDPRAKGQNANPVRCCAEYCTLFAHAAHVFYVLSSRWCPRRRCQRMLRKSA